MTLTRVKGVVEAVTAPAEEPLTLHEAKSHLRVDLDDEDELIQGYVVTAREFAEQFTHLQLMQGTFDLKLECFPEDGKRLVIPRAPVLSITSITYVDTAGVLQTWSSALYQVQKPANDFAEIMPAYGEVWPSVREGLFTGVTVRFVAGWASPADIPWRARTAMLIHVAELYRNRESAITGTIVQDAPNSVKSVLWPLRLVV